MMIPTSSSSDENETDLLKTGAQSGEDAWEAQPHNDDDENQVMFTPLMMMSSSPSSSFNSDEESSSLRQRRKRRRRLKSLELQVLAEEESTYVTGCLGDSWRFVASLILTGLVALPFVLSKWRNHDYGDYGFFQQADRLPCVSLLQEDPSLHVTSFSHAFQTIQKATNFCREVGPASDASTDSCSCTSPFIPKFAVSSRQEKEWGRAFERNMDLIANSTTSTKLNVVMIGDSITERWQGTGMARLKFPDFIPVYQDLFQSNNDASIQGLALGISGDRCPQLLYRLQHGALLPESKLNPQVWWLLIGTNDLTPGGCSPLVVLVGILNIVREILHAKPSAMVVMNSILPRGDLSDGRLDGDLNADIRWINQRLECFSHERVKFFNATSLFANDTHTLDDRLADRLHPSVKGMRLWGTEIVNTVQKLLNDEKG